MFEKLTNGIIDYMKDDTAHYAIALEGEWGSGKTRYCTHELSDELNTLGYTVLRVSLFGVSSADELYNRLAQAILRLSANEDDSQLIKAFKRTGTFMASAVANLGLEKLRESGISFELKSQMLAGLLNTSQLIIFDDFERHRLDDESSETDLLGIINDLVEGQGCKVMLVTNKYLTISPELREKCIWKCFRFEPSPKELADDIIVPKMNSLKADPDLSIRDCITSAAEKAHCTNARAMLKSIELIEMALLSNPAHDASIDIENRMAGLTDFVYYTLLVAMNNTPKKPEPRSNDEPYSIELALKQQAFERYTQLPVIETFFGSTMQVSQSDIDACLASYISSQYAGSPGTMRMRRALDQRLSIQTMDDQEASEFTRNLSDCFMNTSFDIALLPNVIRANEFSKYWGFDNALSDDDILQRAKELVDEDPSEAFHKVHLEYLWWHENEVQNSAMLTSLNNYIVDKYQEARETQLTAMVNVNNPEPTDGEALVNLICDRCNNNWRSFIEFNPTLIAKCFESGNGASQYAIYRLIKKLIKQGLTVSDETEPWAKELFEEFSNIKVDTKTGKMRLCWLITEMEDALKEAN